MAYISPIQRTAMGLIFRPWKFMFDQPRWGELLPNRDSQSGGEIALRQFCVIVQQKGDHKIMG